MHSSHAVNVPRSAASREIAVLAPYALGALFLAGEAAVHIQQYISFMHEVSWIGPLFLVNAAACVVVMAGIASSRLRPLAALAGIVISVAALVSLIISYGTGLFGYQEGGFRTAVAFAMSFEAASVIALAGALAIELGLARVVAPRRSAG